MLLHQGLAKMEPKRGIPVKIGAPKEIEAGESRVAMTPDSAVQLQKLGYDCAIEAGAGAIAGFSDAAYEAAGVEIIKTAAGLFKTVDVVAKVRPPTDTEARYRHIMKDFMLLGACV